jgi:hypothetical protein
MRSCSFRLVLSLGAAAVLAVAAILSASPASASKLPEKTDLPENLAPKATITASSSHSERYQAGNLADGVVPKAMAKDDVGKAWCARGNSHEGGVSIELTWPEPVTLAAVVYYGRTGWTWTENWKDFAIYVDGGQEPVAKGHFKPGHGPQPVKLPEPVRATRLTLKLLNHYGGPNPGASELQCFASLADASALGKFSAPRYVPGHGYAPPPPPDVEESPELLARLKSGGFGFDKLLVASRHHIRSSHVYTYHCEGQKDGGGLYVYSMADGSLEQIVDAGAGQIQNCDLSYDGRRVVFGWRRGAAPYQVFTVNVDGTELVQLTDGPDHNYDPAWLPDGRIVFLSSRRPQAAYCFFTPVGILYTMEADGSNQQCISANYLNDFTPAVLNDGRIIYGRWEYVDRPAIPIQSLWAINPDGTKLEGFFGNRVLDPATFIEPQPIPGTSAILCTMTGHNGSCRGAIGIIDRNVGSNDQEAIRNITPEVMLRGVDRSTNGPRGPYQTPMPVDDTYYLVSYDGTILMRDYDCNQMATVLEPRELGFYNPRPVRSRPVPPVRTSTLPPPEEAGPWAAVYLQDVYHGLAPEVAPGEVKQIAVVQERARALIDSPGIRRPAFGYQRVLVSCGATYVPKKVWGFADVAPDGSAFFKVPANEPIYFVALDEQGRGVHRMRSFTHLMPGEVQGCVGCHETRNKSPRPQLPLAALGEPQELATPEWGRRGFCYADIVQPVWDKYCTECHNARQKPGGVDLSGDRTDYFNVSYEVLARHKQGRTGSPHVSWIPTYNGHEWNILDVAPNRWGSPASKLAELILSGHPDEDGKPRVAIDEASRRRVLMWIDLNVPYYDTAETAHPDLPACRQMLPPRLAPVMNDVYERRCQACHEEKNVDILKTWQPPQWSGGSGPWGGMGVRIENPQDNHFLLAPLAESAGGTGECSEAVFESTDDADYRAVLKTFEPIQALMKKTPRMDMPGAVPCGCSEGKCPTTAKR